MLRKDAILQVHTGHAENTTLVLGELEVCDDTETNDIIMVVSDCEMESIIETNDVEETAMKITNDNLLVNNDFLLRSSITLDHSYAAKPDDYFTLRNENHKLKSNFKKAQRKSILCISKLMQSNKKKTKELLAMSLKLRKLRSTLITQESFPEDAKEIFKKIRMNLETENVCLKIENSQNGSLTLLRFKNFTPIQDTKICGKFFLFLVQEH